MALNRAAGKPGKHRRASRPSRLTRSRAQAVGVATLATGGVAASIAGPALAAGQDDAGPVQDTGLHRAVVLADTLEQRIGDQAEVQQSAADEAAAMAKAEAEAKRRAAEAQRIADAREKEKERAAREAERKRLNTFVAPVADSYVSTSYLASGAAWSSGSHTGVDFHAAAGTSVRSVGSGTVVEAGWDGSYGNSVVIEMSDGTYTQYGHLSSIGVSEGQRVTPGEQVGLAGNTGNSFGAHLHFEARTSAEYGSNIDPVAYLRSHGVSV